MSGEGEGRGVLHTFTVAAAEAVTMAGEAGIGGLLRAMAGGEVVVVRVQAAVPPEQEAVQQKRAATTSVGMGRVEEEALPEQGERAARSPAVAMAQAVAMLASAVAMAGTGKVPMVEPETQTGKGAGTITWRADGEALLP